MDIAKRVYSRMEIKAVDDDRRIITGIASTPATDRDGDVIEPSGAEFTLPVALLWQHRHDEPIGNVTRAKVTDKGIEITAELVVPTDDMPSQLRARLDEAWHSIKSLLVRGLSIGFRAKEYAFLDEGGIHFLKWDWLELSAVTIPAQSQATITSIKSFDQQQIAATGKKSTAVTINPPGDAGKQTPKLPVKVKNMKIAEQIKNFQQSLEAKRAEIAAIMEKSGEEGRTLDAEEEEKYDNLSAEVKSIEAHLVRLKDAEAIEVSKAVAAPGADKGEKGARDVRGKGPVIELAPTLPKGVEFAQYVKCLARANGNRSEALEIAKSTYPDNHRIQNTLKAAVAAGTTTDATWAAPLVEYNNFAGDFIEFLRPQTILGKFGQNGVPALRNVPFLVKIPGQTSGGQGYWVGEGDAKPVTKFDFNSIQLGVAKVANIAVLTEELVRFSSPSADGLVRDALADALRARLDIDFINPAKAAVAGISPASITNGVTAIVSSGDFETDFRALMARFIAAGISPAQGVIITDSLTALSLANVQTPLGEYQYPNITINGGNLKGFPVIVSDYIPRNTAGGLLILANASDILLADDGQVVVDVSREASLQMLDNPTNQSDGATVPTTLVSLWQTNSVGIRAERFINWTKRRPQAVAYVSGTQYTGT